MEAELQAFILGFSISRYNGLASQGENRKPPLSLLSTCVPPSGFNPVSCPSFTFLDEAFKKLKFSWRSSFPFRIHPACLKVKANPFPRCGLAFVMFPWIPCISRLTVHLFRASLAVPDLSARHSANPFKSANSNLLWRREVSCLHVGQGLKHPTKDWAFQKRSS